MVRFFPEFSRIQTEYGEICSTVRQWKLSHSQTNSEKCGNYNLVKMLRTCEGLNFDSLISSYLVR